MFEFDKLFFYFFYIRRFLSIRYSIHKYISVKSKPFVFYASFYDLGEDFQRLEYI